MTKISLRQASVRLEKRTVLHSVSAELNDPGITAVLGRNGAGKTTLLRALAGLLRPASGEILWDGERACALRNIDRAKKLSYLSQSEEGMYSCTVEEFAALGLYPELGFYGGAKEEKEKQRVRWALKALEMESLSSRAMDRLSGGERRRASLARCLVQQSQWMVLDEPLAALDYAAQQELFRTLQQLCARYGKKIVFSVHDPEFALRLADRILLLDGGRLCADIRRKAGWEQELLEALRPVYGESLSLVRAQERAFFYWR